MQIPDLTVNVPRRQPSPAVIGSCCRLLWKGLFSCRLSCSHYWIGALARLQSTQRRSMSIPNQHGPTKLAGDVRFLMLSVCWTLCAWQMLSIWHPTHARH